MSELFMNPLDMAPVVRQDSHVKSDSTEDSDESFEAVLSKKIKQNPSPILTPEALNHSTQRQSYSPPFVAHPGTISQTTVSGNLSSSVMESGANLYPTNLRELLEPTVVPVESTPAPTPEPEVIGSEEKSQHQVQSQVEPQQSSSASPPEDKPATTPVSSYTVKRGDILSQIVADALRDKGTKFNAVTLYRYVRQVAQSNHLTNPNIIHPGQTIDLTAVNQEIINPTENVKTAWVDTMQSPAQGQVVSGFGMRNHPILHEERFHNGIDIAVDIGTPVHSLENGKVTFAGESGGYGKMVEIDHGDGIVTRYAHLSELQVKAGDAVTSDSIVGLSGETGLTTGPHLHFEIRQEGQPIDPLTVLPKAMIEQIPAPPASVRIARADTPSPEA